MTLRQEARGGRSFVRKAIAALAVLSVVAPPALVAWLLGAYGIDVPQWDEWVLMGRLDAWTHGDWGAALWRPHAEHRIPVPLAAFFTSMQLSRWDVRYELWLSFTLALTTWLAIARITRASGFAATTRHRGWVAPAWILAAAASAILFSPIQRSNWLWGWQLQTFLNVGAACWSLSLLTSTSGRRSSVLGAAVLAAIATYSFANGLLLWPLGALVLAAQARPWRQVAAWSLFGTLACGLYLVHYSLPSDNALEWSSIPAFTAKYLGLTFAGTAWDGRLALLIGALGGALFLSALGSFLRLRLGRADRDRVSRELPWLALAAYGFACALFTAFGRAHSSGETVHPRYTTFANLLWLGLAGMLLGRLSGAHLSSVRLAGARLAGAHNLSRARPAVRLLPLLAPMTVTLLAACGLLVAIDEVRGFARSARTTTVIRGQIVRGFLTPAVERLTYPHPEVLRRALHLACEGRLSVYRDLPAAANVDCSLDDAPPDAASWRLDGDAGVLITARGFRVPLSAKVIGELRSVSGSAGQAVSAGEPGLAGQQCIGGWLWDEAMDRGVEDLVALSASEGVERSLARPRRPAVARSFANASMVRSGVRSCFAGEAPMRLFAISSQGTAAEVSQLLEAAEGPE